MYLYLFLIFLVIPNHADASGISYVIGPDGTVHFSYHSSNPDQRKSPLPLKRPPRGYRMREINASVGEAGRETGIAPAFLRAVIRAESDFNPYAVSAAGAQGLMQIMPATAHLLSLSDPFDPRENILAGARYLRVLLNLFNNDPTLALAAYNAGPKRVIQAMGVPPIHETRNYIKRVWRFYRDDAGQFPK